MLTLALNTSGALGHRMFGVALVDAVGPALLTGSSEVGLRMFLQIYAVCSANAPTQPEHRAASGPTLMLPRDLLARAQTRRRAPGGTYHATPFAIRCGSGAIGQALSSPSYAQRRLQRSSLFNCERRSRSPRQDGTRRARNATGGRPYKVTRRCRYSTDALRVRLTVLNSFFGSVHSKRPELYLPSRCLPSGECAAKFSDPMMRLLHNVLRVDEACAADVADLGEDSGHRVLRVVPKGGRKAKVPLTPAMAAALDSYLADRARQAGV